MKLATRTLIALALLATASLGPAATALGQSQDPETPPTDWRLVDPLGLPWRQSAAALAEEALAPATPTWGSQGLMRASTFVYQALAAGNWEIMRNADRVNVTNHPAQDIDPRLNEAVTQIAFASDRTGDFEIFVMNVDGSGLRQITHSPGDDLAPHWSADGRHLVFQSTRDGQSEIYRINADGTGQIRLTNHPGYDGRPNWSPAGNRIAWVAYRNGGYRIWAMAADGSNPVQLSSQPYSFDPVWSRDGGKIAFDADGDGDGWQEMWLMSWDGSNQRWAYRYGLSGPSTTYDTLVGSWAPNGDIAYTAVHYVLYDERWYWDKSLLAAWDPAYPTAWYQLQPWPAKTEWSPDWKTTDHFPPDCQVAPLPEYTRVPAPSSGLTLSWSVVDVGVAGVASYVVQTRALAASAWTDLLLSPGFMSHVIYPGIGTTVYARCRAVDHVGNVESWPVTGADTFTTLYLWRAQGRVLDLRDNPAPGAGLAVLPATIRTIRDAASGDYRAYLAQNGSYTLTAAGPGYGLLPEAVFTVTAWLGSGETDLDLWLPPAANQVTNGGFESGDLSGWQATGVVTPSVVYSASHSGRYGALLAAAPDNPVRLSQQITVPASSHQPTLSLVYRHDATGNPLASGLGVLIDDGAEENVLAYLTEQSDWRHAWFDLQPWLGQTITVSLQLPAAGAAAPPWAELDEIAVGDWTTPRVSSLSVAAITELGSLPVTVTLAGENFIATPTVRLGSVVMDEVTWLDAQTLQVGLPGGLAPGMYDVWVENPGGAAAVLPGGLRLGYFLYLPGVIP